MINTLLIWKSVLLSYFTKKETPINLFFSNYSILEVQAYALPRGWYMERSPYGKYQFEFNLISTGLIFYLFHARAWFLSGFRGGCEESPGLEEFLKFLKFFSWKRIFYYFIFPHFWNFIIFFVSFWKLKSNQKIYEVTR